MDAPGICKIYGTDELDPLRIHCILDDYITCTGSVGDINMINLLKKLTEEKKCILVPHDGKKTIHLPPPSEESIYELKKHKLELYRRVDR